MTAQQGADQRKQRTLHVVILNYRQSAATIECVDSVRGADSGGWTVAVTVVDNASGDGSAQRLEGVGDTLIVSTINGGWAGGNNLGLAHAIDAGADAIMLLNNDVIINHQCLRELLAQLTDNQLAAPRLTDTAGTSWFVDSVLDRNTAKCRPRRHADEPNPFLAGAVLIATTDTWKRLGMLDERYFMYWEDVILAMTANRLGVNLTLVESAEAVHNTSLSSASDGANPFKWYYITRNRLWALRRGALPVNTTQAWLRTPAIALREVAIIFGSTSKHPWQETVAVLRGLAAGLGPMRTSKAYR